MASVSDFLFSGSPPTPAVTGSDTSTAFPRWLQGALLSTVGGAANLAQQPYTPFPGPTVAAPSAQTQQGWNLASSNVGGFQPYLDKAGALTAGATSPITSAGINTFLNPYQNYVTGALNRNLTENLLPSIQDKFVGSGQSRSPQEAEITSRALRDTQNSVGESMAGAYQGALNSYLASRGQQLTGAGQFGNLGALSSELGAADVRQLGTAGAQQDTLAQANLNAAQQQFQQQQMWPYQQLGFLSDIIRGIPVQAAGSTSQTVTTGNLPGATMGAPGFNNIVGSLSDLGKIFGYARGGRVVRRDPRAMGALSDLRMAA